MASRAQSVESDNSILTKALNRLRLRSPTPSYASTSSSRKPLPPRLQQGFGSSQSGRTISLPPYLSHLAEPSTTSGRNGGPTFPQPRRYHDHVRSNANEVNPLHSALPLPRPPTFTTGAYAQQSSRKEHPHSLTPASVPLGSSSKQTYPWELVPQQRTQHAADHTASSSSVSVKESGKENKSPDLGSSSSSRTPGSSSSTVTPPRKHAERSSVASPTPAGLLTPGGAQKDPRCTPSPGQCWGITKDGTRCTRKVRMPSHAAKTPPNRTYRGASAPAQLSKKGAIAAHPLVVHDSDDDSTASPSNSTARARTSTPTSRSSRDTTRLAEHNIDEVYCYQHVAEVNKTAGFYPLTSSSSSQRKSIDYVQFSDWFKTIELDGHTQALLRMCMSRHLSDVDRNERGYIYIYELRDRSTATHLCFKVGRTTNVFRRLSQWRSRCQSKDPLLRAFHPSANTQGLISGGNTANTVEIPGIYFSHRWEALVHIEVAGIGHRVDETCHDCGARHREVFMIPKTASSGDASRQVDAFELTQRIVVKWMRFVQTLA